MPVGTSVSASSPGTTYYVSTSGSDSYPGTEGLPWRTIQKAANTMIAGDTVYVRDGIYQEYVFIGDEYSYTGKSGTTDNPITYAAYPGEHPIIDTSELPNPGWAGMIEFYSVSYITVSGFEIRDTPYQKGILITGDGVRNGSNITIKDLIIHDTYQEGIDVELTSNLTIDNCTVYNNNLLPLSNEQCSLMGVVGFEIKNCVFHDDYTENGPTIKDGCCNGSFHDNLVYNEMSTGIYLGTTTLAQDNIQIYNNIFHDCASPAICINSEEYPYNSVTNIDIYNNLVYNNTEGFTIWPNNFTRSFRLINNVFYNNLAEVAIYGNSKSGKLGNNSNCVIRNNIIVANCRLDQTMINLESPESGMPTIDHNLFYDPSGQYDTFYPSNLIGTNYIKSNPMFVNAAVGDFRLQGGSPAIGNGSSVLAPSFDIAGVSRPQGLGYDIGSYEYVTEVPTPTPTPVVTPTPSPLPTVVPTVVPTKTPTSTPVPTVTPTVTPTPIVTPVPTLTPTPTAVPTVVSTSTPNPTETVEPTSTPIVTSTPTVTPVVTVSPTVTPTPTISPSPTPKPVGRRVHQVIYSPGAFGHLKGDLVQYVLEGDNSTPVAAIPQDGVSFVGWNDGVSDNPRIDTNVTENITVIAYFQVLPNPPKVNTGGTISGTPKDPPTDYMLPGLYGLVQTLPIIFICIGLALSLGAFLSGKSMAGVILLALTLIFTIVGTGLIQSFIP